MLLQNAMRTRLGALHGKSLVHLCRRSLLVFCGSVSLSSCFALLCDVQTAGESKSSKEDDWSDEDN